MFVELVYISWEQFTAASSNFTMFSNVETVFRWTSSFLRELVKKKFDNDRKKELFVTEKAERQLAGVIHEF